MTPRETRSEDTSALGTAVGAISSAASNMTSNATSLLTNATSKEAATTDQRLQEQLDAAKAMIAQHRSQLFEEGLRQRKMDSVVQDSRETLTKGTPAMAAPPQVATGVPVQIVATLCLLSFLLAYLFF